MWFTTSQVAAVAVLCVQPEPSYRPLITDVLHSLIPLVPMELGGTLRISPESPCATRKQSPCWERKGNAWSECGDSVSSYHPSGSDNLWCWVQVIVSCLNCLHWCLPEVECALLVTFNLLIHFIDFRGLRRLYKEASKQCSPLPPPPHWIWLLL